MLIDVIEEMAIKNLQLAVRGSIILSHMVMMCVAENFPIPDNFMNQQFLAHALNWNFAKTPEALQKIVDPTLRDAVAGHFVYHDNDPNQVDPTTRFVIPSGDNDLLGNAWLIDYLVTTFTTNIRVAITSKWKAFINDNIVTFKMINGLNKYSNIPKEMKRLIFNPTKPPMSGAPHLLSCEAWELIEFHRRGFGVFDTDESLDDSYFKDENLYPWHVFHFGKCLEQQCELENQHKQSFPKRMPLPMCNIGQRNSIHIDKKGLYCILQEMQKHYLALGLFPPNLSEARFNNLVSQQRQFTHGMYHDWITHLF